LGENRSSKVRREWAEKKVQTKENGRGRLQRYFGGYDGQLKGKNLTEKPSTAKVAAERDVFRRTTGGLGKRPTMKKKGRRGRSAGEAWSRKF